MFNHLANAAKILISTVGHNRGELLVQVTKAAGARGGTIAMGRSLANNRLLCALSLADVRQDIVFTVMRGETDAVVAAVKEAAAKDPRRLGGLAVLLDVPALFLRLASDDQLKTSPVQDKRSSAMDSGYKLISVIVNSGFGDDMMAAARRAGASGGTILNARGTGTEEDIKFLGITLVPEKEMLLIVAEQAKVDPIVEAMSAVPVLAEPGGGIIFNMNVEEFIVLGQQPTWNE